MAGGACGHRKFQAYWGLMSESWVADGLGLYLSRALLSGMHLP